MAITIDARGVEGGIDYASYLANYYAGVASAFTSTPRGDGDWIDDAQVSFATAGDDEMILLDGNFSYDFIATGPSAGHDISGTLDSVTFGAQDGDTSAEPGEVVTGLDAGLIVSGLGVAAGPFDSPNAVYALYSLLRTAGVTPANLTAIYDAFAAGEQKFLGSGDGDVFAGGAFGDRVSGKGGDDDLAGGDGDDLLRGGGGADTLSGGAGKDRLFGGEGDDTFVFGAKDVGAADLVRGFASGDAIDLSAFGGLDFVDADDFSGTAPELRVVTDGNVSVATADLDGDGTADLTLKVRGDALDAADFLF